MRNGYSSTFAHMSKIPTESVVTVGTSSQTIALTLTPLIVLGLCMLAAFLVICTLKLNLIRKKQKESSTARALNQPYYEIIDPIYETINNAKSDDNTRDNFPMMSNNAYNNIHPQDMKCCHSPSLELEEIDVSSNEAYVPSERIISMQNNSSYQAAPLLNNPMTIIIAVSESPTKKHQCYKKQSIENIQQTDSELLCHQNSTHSVKCASPKHALTQSCESHD